MHILLLAASPDYSHPPDILKFPANLTSCHGSVGHGGIRAIMDDMKLLSTEAEGVREAIPEEHRRNLVNSSERVGALLGLRSEPENGDPDQDRHSQGSSPSRSRVQFSNLMSLSSMDL
jgi:hypothetical protein